MPTISSNFVFSSYDKKYMFESRYHVTYVLYDEQAGGDCKARWLHHIQCACMMYACMCFV